MLVKKWLDSKLLKHPLKKNKTEIGFEKWVAKYAHDSPDVDANILVEGDDGLFVVSRKEALSYVIERISRGAPTFYKQLLYKESSALSS